MSTDSIVTVNGLTRQLVIGGHRVVGIPTKKRGVLSRHLF